ncbi:MAG: hypothetical protein OEV76_10095 [Anaerolineae bacterium]|nr:hypothetical protein [Anaerolineae bacterium]
MLRYVGNAPYCYADSTSMLLASIGEEVPSSRIEVLTGVGLGAFWIGEENLILFSSTPPDAGVSQALTLLGFEYTEKSWPETAPAPLEELRADLAKSPAVLGPLDMGYLAYLPFDEPGADHYVLAYAMDEDQVYLHDPLGFPLVSLPLDRLELAWKAERIDYRRGSYQYWMSPTRARHPSAEEIYERALECFRAGYGRADGLAARLHWSVGRDAILACANHVRSGQVSPGEASRLQGFTFHLGARRVLDFAAFFDFRDGGLAALKRRHATLFGRCHTLAVRKDWLAVAGVLQELADVEGEFRAVLFAC